MKNNKFLIALSLSLALALAMNFGMYGAQRGSSAQGYYPQQAVHQPVYQRNPYQAPTYAPTPAYTPSSYAPTPSYTPTPGYPVTTPTPASPTLKSGYFGGYWEKLRNQAAGAASYVPGYNYLVQNKWLKDIKDYSATRLLLTFGAVIHGLVKAGYNYDTIFNTFFSLAGKIWDKATIGNAVVTGLATLGISAVIADTTK